MPTSTTTVKAPRESSLKSTPRRSWTSVLFEFLILAVTAVIFLEWFLDFCGVGQQEFLEPDSEIGCHHLAGKQVVWRMEGYSSDRLSTTGLRDVEHSISKPAGTTRIALLGDSATEGLQVSLDKTFARVLEKQLNASAGGTPALPEAPATNLSVVQPLVGEQLVRSEQLAAGRRAACCIDPPRAASPRTQPALGAALDSKYEAINFGCSSYSTGQQLLQLEKDVLAYQPDVVALLYVRGSTLENVRDPAKPKAEPRPYFYLDQSGNLQVDRSMISPSGAKPNSLVSFLRRNSRIYGVMTQTDMALSIHEKLYRKLRTFVLSLFTPKSAPASAPVYSKQDGFKVTQAIISKINADCQKRHIRFLLMFFPNTVRDLKYEQELVAFYKQSKKEGFGYLDLTEPFQKHPEPMSLFLQYHFSAAGHQLVANELQHFLGVVQALAPLVR